MSWQCATDPAARS